MKRILSILLLGVLGLVGCATSGDRSARADHYLRYVAYELPFNENVGLRGEKRKMPLKIHLPAPPAAFVENPEAVVDSVRGGITDWADVAGPGVPSFVFVDDIGEADIPIVWDERSSGGDGWFIAYAKPDISWSAKRFGMAEILVTARRQNGQPRSPVPHHAARNGAPARTAETSCTRRSATRPNSPGAIARRCAFSISAPTATESPEPVPSRTSRASPR